MPTIRKTGKRWQAIIRLAGHAPESRTFARLIDARTWAEQRERELRAGTGPSDRTLDDALDRYVRDVTPTHRGSRWEALRVALLRRDAPMAGKRLDALSGADIAAWRDARLKSVGPGTVRREWNILRAALEYARRDLHWIAVNPMADVRRPMAPPHRDRRVSEDELYRLRLALGWPADDAPITTASHRLAVMMLVAVETAMRAGELGGLTWEQVNLDAAFVRLPVTKNGTAREVPLSRRAIELLRLLGPGVGSVFDLNPGSRDVLFRRAREAAGIVDLKFHDTRHEAITRMAKRLPVLALARAVGHRDLRSLQTYYNETASELAKLLD